MRRTWRYLPLLPVLFLCGSCGSNRGAVAIVNGQPISREAYFEYLEHKPQVTVQTQNGSYSLPVQGSLGYQALKDIIMQQAVLQVAKDKGVYPTDAEVQSEVKLRLKENPSYLVGLESEGLTLDVIRDNIRFGLAQDNLITLGVHETTEDAKRYIASHKKQFIIPERVRLLYILVSNQASMSKVDDELGTGDSFQNVALRFSIDPNATAYQGALTDPGQAPPEITQLPDSIRKEVQKLSLYGTTDWISLSGRYAKFYLQKKIAPEPMVIDAARIEEVRRLLAKAKGEKINNVDQMVKAKLKESHIKIESDAYKDAWANDNSL